MKRRFSADELRELRNKIPIDRLIEDVLSIPAKRSEGFFVSYAPFATNFKRRSNPPPIWPGVFVARRTSIPSI